MTRTNAARAAITATFAAAALGLAFPAHAADATTPVAPAKSSVTAAQKAVTAPATLETLSRFFARDGAVSRAAAQPRIQGDAVPVYVLSPEFVSGTADAPIAKLEFIAGTAVSSDGQKASVWTARDGGSWKVVNIAEGADETTYVAKGAAKLSGGAVFQEPQINAWYVQRGERILPLDEDAVGAVGKDGTTVAAYQKRVHDAYGAKLAGSGYDKRGEAGGYGKDSTAVDSGRAPVAQQAAEQRDGGALPALAAAGAAVVVVGAAGFGVSRLRRRQTAAL